MDITFAKRSCTPVRMAIIGRPGTGKTFSALQVAHGLAGNWQKVLVIDTSEDAAGYYAHLGPFCTISLAPPHKPERFIEALDLAQDSGMGVIIIDTLADAWFGCGGVSSHRGRAAVNAARAAHRELLGRINRSDVHLICTVKSRQKFVHVTRDGRVLQKLVEVPIQADGFEHVFHSVVRLSRTQRAHVMKDVTGVFTGHKPVPLEQDHGAFLSRWGAGESAIPAVLLERIHTCSTVAEVHRLLVEEDVKDPAWIAEFTRRRLALEGYEPDLKIVRGGSNDPLCVC